MGNEPLISVILPVYNGEKHLSESIESVLHQSYHKLELIVVDDCSTDSTPDIVRRYADKDARVINLRNEHNQKLPASLNIGFAKARGAYYSWTSDDNAYMPEALQNMAKMLNASPNTGLVYAMCQLMDDGGKDIGLMTSINGVKDDIYYANNVGACFLFRREIFEALNGYDEQLFLVEDYDFWLRAYKITAFQYLDKPLYRYRMHGQSLTQTRKHEILSRVAKLMQRSVPLDSLSEKTKHRVMRRYAEIYASIDNKALAKRYIKAIRKADYDEYIAMDEEIRRYPYGGSGLCYALCSGDCSMREIWGRVKGKFGRR